MCDEGMIATRGRRARVHAPQITVAVLAALLSADAGAFHLDLGVPKLDTSFDTDVRYAVGVRTEARNEAIGNGMFFDEGDYRFDQGDVVTDRLDATPQLNIKYSPGWSFANSFGLRVSGNLFKDFAYGFNDKQVRSRPGSAPTELPPGLLGPDQVAIPTPTLGPAVPYSQLTSYYNGLDYNAIKRNINTAELQDAFAFINFSVGNVPVNLKGGAHTLFWGEALFSPFFGVSYGMGPIDINKALTIPAVSAQDLFIPVNQISGTIIPLNSLTVGFQYFLDWRQVRAPEGGTYLGTADPFLDGPERLFLGNLPVTGPYFIPHDAPVNGRNNNKFGIQLKWDVLDSTTLGFYYRRFDETLPWVQVLPATPQNQPNIFGNLQALLTGLSTILGPIDPTKLPVFPGAYRYVYPQSTTLYGTSVSSKVFGVSVGADVAYTHNRALLSELLDREGGSGNKARGDLLSGVVNALYIFNNAEIFGIKLFDQAPLVAEMNWSYLVKVTSRDDVYKSVGSDSCKRDAALFGAPGVSGDTVDWCASRYHIGGAAAFQPTWFSVAPQIDLNAVLFYQNVFINDSPANLAAAKGFGNASAGLGFTYRQALSVSLNYNMFFSDYRTGKNVAGETTITSFNGLGTVADRDYLSLTAKYSF